MSVTNECKIDEFKESSKFYSFLWSFRFGLNVLFCIKEDLSRK
jgi:hypothetical protein